VDPTAGVPADDVAVLLTYYERQHRQWTPVASTYDPAHHTVAATVGHLSWWNSLSRNYHGLSFRDFVHGSEPQQARCPNEGDARADGTKVVSGDGRRGVLLDGGQQVTLYPHQAPGSTRLVGVKPSSGGYLLGDLEYAASTLEFVSGKVPGARERSRRAALDLGKCIPELANTIGAAGVDDATDGLQPALLRESLRCVGQPPGARAARFLVYNGKITGILAGDEKRVVGVEYICV
jgi:hypothetical protein